uniref:Mitochondrial carrier homolog 1 n=1 Tax=Cacopsylla melanoneura TaxID=428564 RepID=A0A8D8VK65_9HEMI
MKLLLGAKKYLEQCELKKQKAMEPERDIDEVDDDFVIPEQKNLAMKMIVALGFHPLDYAKHLIMLGHEPLAPYQTPWFGRSYYMYPNVLKYVGHIYSVDGVLGCFRGIVYKQSNVFIQHTLLTYFDKEYPGPAVSQSLVSKLKRNITVKCICTIASHPLQLMMVRCMAQFVGRENVCSEWNPLVNLFRILKLEGLAGLFKGFWARLAGECALVATSVIIVHGMYKLARHMDPDSDPASTEKSMVLYSTLVNFVCQSLFYPYHVVSTTMSVNNSEFKIGNPPLSPIFSNSVDCYNHLRYFNQTKRGSSLFYRFVPTVSNGLLKAA